mgnify:CR=1 FL=1
MINEDIKMSDVFDLPFQDQGHNSFVTDNWDETKAAIHAINNHDPMALRIKELENQNSLLEGGLKGFIHLMGLIESGSLENYPDHLSNYSDHCAEILEQSK